MKPTRVLAALAVLMGLGAVTAQLQGRVDADQRLAAI